MNQSNNQTTTTEKVIIALWSLTNSTLRNQDDRNKIQRKGAIAV